MIYLKVKCLVLAYISSLFFFTLALDEWLLKNEILNTGVKCAPLESSALCKVWPQVHRGHLEGSKAIKLWHTLVHSQT